MDEAIMLKLLQRTVEAVDHLRIADFNKTYRELRRVRNDIQIYLINNYEGIANAPTILHPRLKSV